MSSRMPPSLLRLGLTLCGCAFASLACAGTGDTFLHYRCSFGHGVASANYELVVVVGDKFRVETYTPGFVYLRAHGALSDSDQLALLRMAPSLSESFKTLKDLRDNSLGYGDCDWTFQVGDAMGKARFPNMELGAEFKEFLAWVRALQAHDARHQAILPIIPGEGAQYSPYSRPR